MLLIVLLVIWISKLRLYLLKEVRKRHLFQYNFYKYYYLSQYIDQCREAKKPVEFGLEYVPKYNRFCDRVEIFYSYQYVMYRLIIFINKKIPNNKTFQYPKEDSTVIMAPRSFIFCIRLLPIFILLTIILLECFFQNWILHYTFYYLPVYFMYNLWFNATEFLSNTNKEINRMIYERYYEENNVLYNNLTEEEDKIFDDYLQNGLKCPSSFFRWSQEHLDYCYITLNWKQFILHNRRYFRVDAYRQLNRFIYCNEEGVMFEMHVKDFEKLKNSKVD